MSRPSTAPGPRGATNAWLPGLLIVWLLTLGGCPAEGALEIQLEVPAGAPELNPMDDERLASFTLQMTDLAGGRIITNTQDEVKQVCAEIETLFTIDWANTVDTSKRLGTSEFGYRSVHYIVQIPKDAEDILGVKVKGFDNDMKAEIQVRTLLECRRLDDDIGQDARVDPVDGGRHAALGTRHRLAGLLGRGWVADGSLGATGALREGLAGLLRRMLCQFRGLGRGP